MKNSIAATLGVVGLAAVVLVLAAPPAAAEEPAPAADADGIVAYYFHGNVRCATCRKIEAYADEAIHSGFAEAFDTGALRWSVVNVDEPDNKHFVQDFDLVTRAVVLAEVRAGKVVRFKNLDKVWQLVRDEEAFADYIQNETREFLGAS